MAQTTIQQVMKAKFPKASADQISDAFRAANEKVDKDLPEAQYRQKVMAGMEAILKGTIKESQLDEAKAYDQGYSDGIEGKKANNPYDNLDPNSGLYKTGYKDGKGKLPKKKKEVKEGQKGNTCPSCKEGSLFWDTKVKGAVCDTCGEQYYSKEMIKKVKPLKESYLDKALNTLCEAVAKWYPTDDEIEAYAEKMGLDWGKAEKKLAAERKEIEAKKRDKNYWENERKRAERYDAKIERENRPPKPKLTKAQYDKLCYGAAHDWIADNPEYEGEDVWYDMADAVLYNPDVRAYLNYSYYSFHKKLPGKYILKDILADDIYSFVDKAKKDVAKENEAWERKQAKKKKTVKESNFDTYLNLLK